MTELEQQWTGALDSESAALEAAARAQTLPAVEVGAHRRQLELERTQLAMVDWASFDRSHPRTESCRAGLGKPLADTCRKGEAEISSLHDLKSPAPEEARCNPLSDWQLRQTYPTRRGLGWATVVSSSCQSALVSPTGTSRPARPMVSSSLCLSGSSVARTKPRNVPLRSAWSSAACWSGSKGRRTYTWNIVVWGGSGTISIPSSSASATPSSRAWATSSEIRGSTSSRPRSAAIK